MKKRILAVLLLLSTASHAEVYTCMTDKGKKQIDIDSSTTIIDKQKYNFETIIKLSNGKDLYVYSYDKEKYVGFADVETSLLQMIVTDNKGDMILHGECKKQVD